MFLFSLKHAGNQHHSMFIFSFEHVETPTEIFFIVYFLIKTNKEPGRELSLRCLFPQ